MPVEKSLISTQTLAPILETHYELHEVRCQLLQAAMRDVYRVRAREGQHILFIYRHQQRTRGAIVEEWDFIDYLAKNGVSVAPAIRKNNDDLILTLNAPEGMRYAVLTTLVEGKHLRQRYSLQAVRDYGRSIAQVHTLSDAIPLPTHRPSHEFQSLVQQPLKVLETVLENRPGDVAYLRGVSSLLQTHFNTLSKSKPHYGMIHGDVIRANAQVSPDGKVTVLDFDLCGVGWRAYDIASYLEVAETDEARHTFLKAYLEIRTLDEEELAALPYLRAARCIFTLGIPAMNIYHWGRAYLTDAMIDAALESIRQNLRNEPSIS